MARFTYSCAVLAGIPQFFPAPAQSLPAMIIVPIDALSEAALAGVVDAFILREGTDYGHREYSLEDKRRRVHAMLASGSAQICYYPENEHIDIELVD